MNFKIRRNLNKIAFSIEICIHLLEKSILLQKVEIKAFYKKRVYNKNITNYKEV